MSIHPMQSGQSFSMMRTVRRSHILFFRNLEEGYWPFGKLGNYNESYADEIGKMANILYEEYQHDRRLTASVLTANPFGKIGFWCLDHEEPGHIYLRQLPLNMYCKMIPEYKPEEVTQLFQLKSGGNKNGIREL